MGIFTILGIATAASLGVAVMGAVLHDKTDSFSVAEVVCEAALFIGGVASLILASSMLFCAIRFKKAGVETRLVNATYGTSYTVEDVFYASSVIEEINDQKRSRNEIQLKLEDKGRHDPEKPPAIPMDAATNAGIILCSKPPSP